MSAINRGAEYVTGRAEKFDNKDGLPSKVGDWKLSPIKQIILCQSLSFQTIFSSKNLTS